MSNCIIQACGPIESMDVSPDPEQIACAIYKSIIIYSLKTYAQNTILGHSSRIWVVKYCPIGQFIASGSGDFTKEGDNSIRIWDAKTQQVVKKLIAHKSQICSLAFTSNQLVSGSKDQVVIVWDWKNAIKLKKLSIRSNVEQLIYSPCQSNFVSVSDHLAQWSSTKFYKIQEHDFGYYYNKQAHYSENGRLIVSISLNSQIRIIVLQALKTIASIFKKDMSKGPISFSKKQQLLLIGCTPRKIQLWNLLKGKQLRIFSVPQYNVFTLSFSCDETFIISTGFNFIMSTKLFFK